MSEPHATHDVREVVSAEFVAAARHAHLRLEFALVLQTLRASVGLTQKELAERRGPRPDVERPSRPVRFDGGHAHA